MTNAESEYDAFISYKSEDEPSARRLKEALEARGLRVWLDKDEIRPGDLFPTALARGVESSTSLALLVSPEALQSGWVEEEYSKALVLANRPGRPRLQIIPVILRDAELPGFMGTRQWVDFRDESTFDQGLELLIWGITGDRPEQAAPSAARPGTSLTPLPPRPHFAHPYPLQEHFTGRVTFRTLLTQWLTQDNRPVLCLTAIGGTGKSALAWAWVNRDVVGSELPGLPLDPPDVTEACRVADASRPEGILWWSFYERESTFSAFLDAALAYTSGGTVNPAGIPSDHEKVEALLNLLQQRRFLLILDGFERQLRAYASLSAPYQGDAVTEDERGDFRSCVDPHATRFLQQAAALPLQSRLLLTSRLFPRCLDGLAGCRHEDLTNMNLDEALAFFNAHRIQCTRAEIEDACQPYGYHPLSLRLLAGLIVADKRNPRDIQVAKRHTILPDLKGKEQHHILEVSYNALNPPRRKLLSSLAAFRSPMAYDAIAIFNPWKTEKSFDSAVQELVDRGLLLHDREHNRYDLHPIVRQHAYDRLADKTGAHTRLRDYFAAVPTPEEDQIQTLDDLAPTIELYHHTVRAGQYDEALQLFRDRLAAPLYFRFGAYRTCIELLRALFPDGEDEPPRLRTEAAQSWTLNDLANSYELSGQPRRAEPLFAAQNQLQEKAEHKLNLAIGLDNLAQTQLVLGKLDDGEQNLRRSIDLCREIKEEFQQAVGLKELGRVLLHRGVSDDAARELDAALAIDTRRRNIQAQGLIWAYRAMRALLMRDPRAALNAARRARELADETATVEYPYERDFVEAEWLQGAALVALSAEEEADREQHLADAESHLTDALTRCRRTNLLELEPDILLAWARWHQLKGNAAQARKDADEALRVADRCEYRLKQADCHNFLAALSREEGDTDAAIRHARTAYERAWCDGPPHCYKPALDQATSLLQSLGADLPPPPPTAP